MSTIDRLVDLVSERSKLVIVVILLLTVVMGVGMGQVSQDSSFEQFSFDSDAEAAQSYVNENFTATDENATSVQVIFRADGGNALTREALIEEIELQEEIRADEEVAGTLDDETPFSGLSNAVAMARIDQQRGGGPGAEPSQQRPPSLEEQRQALESTSDEEFQQLLAGLLGGDAGGSGLSNFLPQSYESGETSADARMMLVTQQVEGGVGAQGSASQAITDSQLRIDEIVDERFGDDAFTFGSGVVTDEIERSMGDSLAIVLPLALLFVTVVLTIAYRDVLDILVGLLGIFFVLIWTFGFMGWANITFNQLMITVPVLLVGLSIDYAIHVFMRHREQRQEAGNGGSRRAMRTVLLGLGAALVWVTITAMIGFLSNLVSPMAPIQDFGLASAFGIAATLAIYGTFVPATKLELDEFLEGRGWDRKKRAFGTGGGVFTTFLSGGKTLAQRAPWAVIGVALLLTLGGVYGATQLDTSFQQEDFLADEPADWMDSLPGPFAPGDYQIKSQMDYVDDHFSRDQTVPILVRGNVTSDDTLERVDSTERAAADREAFGTLLDGRPDLQSPLRGMQTYASQNPDSEFNETFNAADIDDDGVPDTNVAGVYDAYFEAAPQQAAGTIHRTDDGEYQALQIVLTKAGPASTGETVSAARDLANEFGADATATGQLVVFDVIEGELLDTVIETLIITIVAVIAFLMVAYRFVHGSAILGAVTLTPIVLTVAWILGTMWLLGIGFNVITGTLTSLTIGLGVAYNIHVNERFQLELDRGKGVWDAIHDAVTGTGGALLGSAGTTIGGFGVLAFAILPPLQQFGIITGITIFYAFLASVFVLPSFLVLWTKYLGPEVAFEDDHAGVQDVPPADE